MPPKGKGKKKVQDDDDDDWEALLDQEILNNEANAPPPPRPDRVVHQAGSRQRSSKHPPPAPAVYVPATGWSTRWSAAAAGQASAERQASATGVPVMAAGAVARRPAGAW